MIRIKVIDISTKMQKNMFKTTKANLKWMDVNKDTMEILYKYINIKDVKKHLQEFCLEELFALWAPGDRI